MAISAPGVSVVDRAAAPRPPSEERLRDGFFATVERLTLGLVRGERWRLRAGPIRLLTFGEPRLHDGAWTWPITGGLLARQPGGTLSYGWREGELRCRVEGYRPLLPRPLYLALQLPAHHLLSRFYLLRLRGRVPAPGVPAGPAQRLAAAALDLSVCAALTRAWGPRRPLWAFGAVTLAYHAAFWASSGRTPGGRVLGQRLRAVDGSRPDLLQVAVRMAALPLALGRRRALHDEAAATELVRD